jgi:hypothetical protein
VTTVHDQSELGTIYALDLPDCLAFGAEQLGMEHLVNVAMRDGSEEGFPATIIV